jgi:hypothetical protein
VSAEERFDGMRRAAWLVLVPVVCLLALPFLVLELGPAWTARTGGTEGAFTAVERVCDDDGGGCRWTGRFRAPGGTVREDVRLLGAGGVERVGDVVPAVDTGRRGAVYPEGGGSSWLVVTGLLVVVVAVLALWGRAVLRRVRR